MIAELSFIALVLLAGVPLVLRLSQYSPEPSSRVGEGILLGMAVCAATLAILPWQRWIVVTVIVIVAAAAFRPRRIELNPGWLVLLLLSGYALYATVAPSPEYDYLTNWGFKAKAFFEVRAIDWQLLGRGIVRNVHPDYPLLLPLVYDFIAVLRDGWNDTHLGIVHVAFAAALLLVIYKNAWKTVRSARICITGSRS